MARPWTELSYLAEGRGERQLAVRVSGSMLHDLTILDDSKQGWGTVSEKGHLIGAALGKARRDGGEGGTAGISQQQQSLPHLCCLVCGGRGSLRGHGQADNACHWGDG